MNVLHIIEQVLWQELKHLAVEDVKILIGDIKEFLEGHPVVHKAENKDGASND